MKKSDLQVYFYTLSKRFDNMLHDPKTQWSDYQRLASDALVVLGNTVDEWPDNEQKRLKAYHNGYGQGRFDEQAEQWLKANSQKAETKQWKSCPYCHGIKNLLQSNDERPIDGDIVYINSNGYLNLEASLHAYRKVNYCPMCGRPLNEESE